MEGLYHSRKSVTQTSTCSHRKLSANLFPRGVAITGFVFVEGTNSSLKELDNDMEIKNVESPSTTMTVWEI